MKRLLAIALLMVSSAAFGEVYTWVDGKGTAHYTNSLYEIPARYRDKAKTLNLGTEPPVDRSTTAQPVPQPPQPVVPEAAQQKNRPVLAPRRPARHREDSDE